MAKYEPKLNLLFAALGDATRRAILARLALGPASVSELAAPHDMALPSFLAHLRKLEDAGLVVTSKTGRIRTYALLPDAFAPARGWLEEQCDAWEGRLDRFDDYAINLMKERRHGS